MTVMKELMTTVPSERIVYFGDTARVPYGTKSVETVRRYAREDTELLLDHDVKLIVIACNTVSALALDIVQEMAAGIPVIGMIEPCVREVMRVMRGRVGIIGTEGTIESKAYENGLKIAAASEGRSIETFSVACPLLVPLAEEGWIDHPATELVVEEYLAPLRDAGVDTLILGCTHYPVLADVIQRVMGPEVKLINSGAEAAREVRVLLGGVDEVSTLPDCQVLVSDMPRKFERIAERFLGRAMPETKQVQFREAWVVKRG